MASSKNYTEVLIGGKVFTLSGFESEEYLQKVSTYLNHKLEECTNSEGYRKQSAETRSILLALNIADDYFKAKKQGGTLESDIEAKDKEMYDLKHELVSLRMQIEEAQKNYKKQLNEMKEYILSRTDIPEKVFNKNKAKDWYLTSNELVEYKVLDKLVDNFSDILN
jgi:cell division protein ZapA